MDKHHIRNKQYCANCFTLEKEIVALKEDLAEMKQHAYHDVLTGIPNRRLFVESLDDRVAQCRQYGDNCAVLFLDVDNLKAINDEHGHAAGDALLARMAKILKTHIRSTDVVARLGGDEFGLLLDNLNGDQVAEKIDSLVEHFNRVNFVHADKPLPFGAAIGYCFVGPQDTTEGLMSRADASMYRTKDRFK
ncbi:GGDEF domain-containing protein [Parasphingorhabdus sp.]|uniref:GGDEF domain-containing protein n=1 Tax=Parasphingorhabdus sp. TaxID=2709688 RepID=UPI003592EDED